MWKRYAIALAVKNRIIGGTPTDPQLIKGWIAANMPDVEKAEQEKLAAKTAQELPAATEEAAEAMWTTFKRDENGIYIEGRQIKSMFKECANILRDALQKTEVKRKDSTKSRYTNLKAKLAERLFVEDDKVYLTRNGERIKTPDGMEERAIHVMTAQGPRSALKRVDYVSSPAQIDFTVRHLNDGVVDDALIKTILEFAGWNGLGADRSQGNGLFGLKDMAEIHATVATA